MRVLIVDDSVVMRMIVERALRQTGLGMREVLQAGNGAEGLEILAATDAERKPIDLIMSDIHMPVMNGLEFLHERHLRKLAPGVPMVMITADPSDPMVHMAISSGADGYILKPFTLDQVRTTIAKLLPVTV